jgi:hypothetical protein
MNVLSGLKISFIVYFIIKTIIDIYLVTINRDIFDELNRYGVTDINVTTESMVLIIFLINALLFIIGLWLFNALESKKEWARVLLIIAGWLVILNFFLGVILSSQSVEMLKDLRITVDWDKLILEDFISDLLSLVYFSFIIYMLQFNMKVRQMFE